MSFQLTTKLFLRVDETASTFITDMTQKAVTMLMPVVVTGLTLSFIAYGILIIRGLVEVPITDFLAKNFRILIITSFIFTSGFYQSHILQMVQELPDQVASSLIKDAHQGESAASLIDQAAEKGFNRAKHAFSMGGWFSGEGLVYILFALIILLTTAALTAVGAAYLLLAKIALNLLLALGPFFIASLLFESTKHFFEKWVTQIINYILTVVLFSAIFVLMMDIFGDYVSGIDFNDAINVSSSLGGAILLSIAMIVILLQLPNLASALAGGIGLSYSNELRSIGRGAAAINRLIKPLINPRTHVAENSLRKTQGYSQGKHVSKADTHALVHQSPQMIGTQPTTIEYHKGRKALGKLPQSGG